jgi:hypothetical protein
VKGLEDAAMYAAALDTEDLEEDEVEEEEVEKDDLEEEDPEEDDSDEKDSDEDDYEKELENGTIGEEPLAARTKHCWFEDAFDDEIGDMPIARLRRVTEEGVVTEPLEKTPKEEVYEFMVEKGMREG